MLGMKRMGHFCNVLSRHSSSYSSKKVAFVRAPSSVLNEGIVTHIESKSHEKVDELKQQRKLISALKKDHRIRFLLR